MPKQILTKGHSSPAVPTPMGALSKATIGSSSPREPGAAPSPDQRKSLDKIHLNGLEKQQPFQDWIVHYGTLMVAHAVMFQRAAEVVTGRRSVESFKHSLAGEKPPPLQFDVQRPLVGSLRELAKQIYIPPCAFEIARDTKVRRDVAIPFLDSDLANIFYEKPKTFTLGPSHSLCGEALTRFAKFSYEVRELHQLLQPETVKKGIGFTADGFARTVSTHEALSESQGSTAPEGAHALIAYYQAVVTAHCSRGSDILRTGKRSAKT